MANMTIVRVLVVLFVILAGLDNNIFSIASRSRSRHHSAHRRAVKSHHKRGGMFFSEGDHRLEHHPELLCDDVLSEELKNDIDGYRETVERIINQVLVNERGETYRQIKEFVETFGPRSITSPSLGMAADDRVAYLTEIVPDDVAKQVTKVDVVQRGSSQVTLLNAMYNGNNRTVLKVAMPLEQCMETTRIEDITAPIRIARSFTDLEAMRASKVTGAAILLSADIDDPGDYMAFAHEAVSRVQDKGAAALLIKTLAIPTQSTRVVEIINPASRSRIPIFSVSSADADFIVRRATTDPNGLRVHIKSERALGNHGLPVWSDNIVAELRGHALPNERVLITGHLDTWDASQNAFDDAAGAGITWRVLEVLKHLGLKARRSIRIALYVDEELGFQHYDSKLNDFRYIARATQFVLKTDSASYVGGPLGISTNVKNKKTRCIIDRTLKLFDAIQARQLDTTQCTRDPEQWHTYGVPTGSMFFKNSPNEESRTPTRSEKRNTLDRATALWAGLAFVFADLAEKFPINAESL